MSTGNFLAEAALEARGQLDIRRKLDQRWLPAERHVGLLTSVAVTRLDVWYSWPSCDGDTQEAGAGQWQSRAVLCGFIYYHYY